MRVSWLCKWVKWVPFRATDHHENQYDSTPLLAAYRSFQPMSASGPIPGVPTPCPSPSKGKSARFTFSRGWAYLDRLLRLDYNDGAKASRPRDRTDKACKAGGGRHRPNTPYARSAKRSSALIDSTRWASTGACETSRAGRLCVTPNARPRLVSSYGLLRQYFPNTSLVSKPRPCVSSTFRLCQKLSIGALS